MKSGFLLNPTTRHGQLLGPLQDQRSNHRHQQSTGWGGSGGSSSIALNNNSTGRWDNSTRRSSGSATGDSSGGGWGSVPAAAGWGSPTKATSTTAAAAAADAAAAVGRPDSTTGPYANVPILPFKTAGVPMAALVAYYGQQTYPPPALVVQLVHMADFYHTWHDGNPHTDKLQWTCLYCCPYTAELFVAGRWPGLRPPPPPKQQQQPVVATTATTTQSCTSHTRDTAAGTTTAVGNTLPRPRWMPNKKAAQHGAAAWAYDCFHYRLEQQTAAAAAAAPTTTTTTGGCSTTNKNNATKVRYARLGLEDPYLEPCYSLPLLSTMTDDDDDGDTTAKNVWSCMPAGLAVEIAAQQALVRARLAKEIAAVASSAEKSSSSSHNRMDEVEEQAWQRPIPPPAIMGVVSTTGDDNAVPLEEEDTMES
jgi:hypothetical protein